MSTPAVTPEGGSSAPEKRVDSDAHILVSEALTQLAGSIHNHSDASLYASMVLSVTGMPVRAMDVYASRDFYGSNFGSAASTAIAPEVIEEGQRRHRIDSVIRLACDVTVGTYAPKFSEKQAASVLVAGLDAAIAVGATAEEARRVLEETFAWLWATNVRHQQRAHSDALRFAVDPAHVESIAVVLGINLPSRESILDEQARRVAAMEERRATKK
jgi:hypothetical protein